MRRISHRDNSTSTVWLSEPFRLIKALPRSAICLAPWAERRRFTRRLHTFTWCWPSRSKASEPLLKETHVGSKSSSDWLSPRLHQEVGLDLVHREEAVRPMASRGHQAP